LAYLKSTEILVLRDPNTFGPLFAVAKSHILDVEVTKAKSYSKEGAGDFFPDLAENHS
jgi:hypothetical protein